VCVYPCAQLSYTTQHAAVPTVSPRPGLDQKIITAQMLSSGRGRRRTNLCGRQSKERRGGGGWSRAVYVTHHRQTRPRRPRQRDRQTERERERGSRVIHKHSCVVQRLDGESRATLNFVNNHRDALLARADNESARRRCIHRRTGCRGSDVPLHTACSM